MILKYPPKLGFRMERIRLMIGFAGQWRPPYRTLPDSVQNCRRAQKYVQVLCALVRTHFSFSRDSVGSSGMGYFTGLPITKGVLRNGGISRTGWLLTLTYSSAQSIMAKTSTVALSTPGPKKRMAWTSG